MKKWLIFVLFLVVLFIPPVLSASCTYDYDCDSTSVCVSGTCTIKANRGSEQHCHATQNCVNGLRCLDGQCLKECTSAAQCSAGQNCLRSAYSSSGYYEGNNNPGQSDYFNIMACTSRKKVVNEICYSLTECQTGLICDITGPSRLCKKTYDGSCTKNGFECAQFLACDNTLNKCRVGPTDSCLSNTSQCYCNIARLCANGNVCFNNHCVDPTKCITSADCPDSGKCVNGKCIGGYNYSCANDASICASFLACDSFALKCRVQQGSICSSTKQCVNQGIINNINVNYSCSEDRCKANVGGLCSSDNDCVTGLVCNSTNKCINKKKIDELCEKDFECEKGLTCSTTQIKQCNLENTLCTSKIIKNCKIAVGQNCVKDSECQYGSYCLLSRCTSLSMEVLTYYPLGYQFVNEITIKKPAVNTMTWLFLNVKIESDPKQDLSGFDVNFSLFMNNGSLLANAGTLGTTQKTNSTGMISNGRKFDIKNTNANNFFGSNILYVTVNKSDIIINNFNTIKINQECALDADCSLGKFCVNQKCVQCKQNLGCGLNEICVNDICVLSGDSCSKDSDCSADKKCISGLCLLTEKPGNKDTPGGSDSSSSCIGISCSSNKKCYWNTSAGIMTDEDFYISSGTGMYCCAPWKTDNNITQSAGKPVCVGELINPVTGASTTLLEGECVSSDGSAFGTRIDIICTDVNNFGTCTQLPPVACKIVPADLSAKLSFYGAYSIILTLLILGLFYNRRKGKL